MSVYTLYHPETRKPVTVDRRTEAAFLKQGYTRNPNAPKAVASMDPASKPAAPTSTTPAPVDTSDPLAAITNAKGKAELFAVAKALGTRVPDEVTKAADIRTFLLEAHKPAEPPATGESEGAPAEGDAADDTGDLI